MSFYPPGHNSSACEVQVAAKGKDSTAEAAWRRQIDILYAQFAAECKAEEADQLVRLRRANGR
ncbi:hypothetical protein [Variovorax sp. OV329]|uniref:hypothetical protein n=1 Tax=Variovorax sp. OV329 TaxID=1882825 RepID=UPI000B886B5D|nr:hypothetical protein [Variovorax sp. OV329]